MVKKAEFVKRLLSEVNVRGSYPKRRKDGFSLLEEGVKAILMRHLPEKSAESSVLALRVGFVDWNEARVSQAQEIASHLKTGSRGGRVERLEKHRAAAFDVKTFLQEVFQKTHGLDLETTCEDMVEA
ncbi:MAG: hypothetical protein MK291_11400, partial [Planctomycetes bacterium]|nr:hypothetical protein [Planctomycetota bacterium]